MRAAELGANTFQIFSSSPRMWKASVPKKEDIALLRQARQRLDLTPLVVHDSYLINLAAAEAEVRDKSIAAFRAELQRCVAIGAEFLVAHPGNGKDQSLEQALVNVARGVIEASEGMDTGHLTLCLEGTAGQGATLGATFEELSAIRELVSAHSTLRVGYCLDTCHLLAAGFDIASEAGLAEVTRQVRTQLGWDNVHVIHANDSKHPLNSRLDRHAHIGEGYIGRDGFQRILQHPEWREKPFILETPQDEEGDELRNMGALQELCQKSSTRTRSLNRSGLNGGS